MIMYDVLLIFQYQVSTTVMDLFVFMLVLLCFCVATEFSVNKDLYINGGMKDRGKIRQPKSLKDMAGVTTMPLLVLMN